MFSPFFFAVIPAKAGIHFLALDAGAMDSRCRGNDGTRLIDPT
jgi:hypothetical protein